MNSITGENSQLAILYLVNKPRCVPKLGPNRSPLPDQEVSICLRVREIREALKWKQRDFADKLGIPKARLASYEYARAPIRYRTAKKIGEEFQINLGWIANGKGPPSPYIPISPSSEAKIRPNELLSEAYTRVLKQAIFEESLAVLSKRPGSGLRVFERVEDSKAKLVTEFLDVTDRLLGLCRQAIAGKDLSDQRAMDILEKRYAELVPKIRSINSKNPVFVKALVREITRASALTSAHDAAKTYTEESIPSILRSLGRI